MLPLHLYGNEDMTMYLDLEYINAKAFIHYILKKKDMDFAWLQRYKNKRLTFSDTLTATIFNCDLKKF